MGTLTDDLIKLSNLKAARTQMKAHYDEVDRAFRKHEAHCIDRMENDEEKPISSHVAGDVGYSKAETIYASMQDREQFRNWAELNAPDLLELKERSGDLSGYVRAALDDGRPPPPGVGFYVKKYISQRAK